MSFDINSRESRMYNGEYPGVGTLLRRVASLSLSVVCAPIVMGATNAGVQSPVVIDGRITQHHGQYVRPRDRWATHLGLDLAAPVPGTPCIGRETPIRAFADGTVRMILRATDPDRLSQSLGNAILIEHAAANSTFYTTYLHMASAPQDESGRVLNASDPVIRGQVIGYIGGTGTSANGCHVHFEVKMTPEWDGRWRIAPADPDPSVDENNYERNVYGLGNVTVREPYEENWLNFHQNWLDPLSLFCTYPGGMRSGDPLAGNCAGDQIRIAAGGANVRDEPMGTVLFDLPSGSANTITEGPRYSDRNPNWPWWWGIGDCDADGCHTLGWVAAPLGIAFRVIRPGESRAGYSLSLDRRADYRDQPIAQVPDTTTPGLRLLITLVSVPSPIRGLEYVVVWDLEAGGRNARIVDPRNQRVVSEEIVQQVMLRDATGTHTGFVPISPIIQWAPSELHAVIGPHGPVQDRLFVADLHTGRVSTVRVEGFERDLCDIQRIDLLGGEWVSDTTLRLQIKIEKNPWAEEMEGYRPGMCERWADPDAYDVSLDVLRLSLTTPASSDGPGSNQLSQSAATASRSPGPVVTMPVLLPTSQSSLKRCISDESRRRGEQGEVVMNITVSAAGTPTSMTLARSSGYRDLDLAAECIYKKFRFKPATRNGQPIESQVRVPFTVSLP